MKRKALAVLLVFNGITAILGGLGLVTNVVAPPESWLGGTPFSSYMLPGVILTLIGSCALIAYFSYGAFRHKAWEISAASGILIAIWIVGEMILLGHHSLLQPLYLFSGAAVILLSYQTRRDYRF